MIIDIVVFKFIILLFAFYVYPTCLFFSFSLLSLWWIFKFSFYFHYHFVSYTWLYFLSDCFTIYNQYTSVTQSCPTLCNPMDYSMIGLPVHQQLLEFAQTHVRWGDAIQPSHPLSSPSPATFNLSQHQIFSNESALWIRWPKYWSFSFIISPSNEHSGLISFRMHWLDLLAVQGTLKNMHI